MRWDTIMEGFWIVQDSEYAKFLQFWICLNMSEFMIIDRVLNVSYDTYCKVTLHIIQNLLKDEHIQNPVKDLRYNTEEKNFL